MIRAKLLLLARRMSNRKQLRRLGLFDARVPRYTSYPTAPQFTDAIGPAQTAEWLGAIEPGAEISVYLHIPFCRNLCWFCACRTQGTQTLAPVAAYVETLKKEVALFADNLPDAVSISHLHLGGGTPTLLSPELIGELTETLLKRVPLADQAQFSVEIDPSEVDRARIDALVAAGMNRASIGVQDFDPDIQTLIGRVQGYELTREVVESLRDAGIGSVNMDILYGLPNQDNASISETVQKVLSLNPDRVALYGYAHVPWMARRQTLIPTELLPTAETRLELFEAARDLFLWDGYLPIGIDHFARPGDSMAIVAGEGRLRRNFQGYTVEKSDVLVGLGASAISRYPQGYAQNIPATSGYQAAIRDGGLATARGHAFSGEDIVRGRIIEELMCQFRVDFAALGDELGLPPSDIADIMRPQIGEYAEVVDLTAEYLEIHPHAHPLVRVIARQFDAYDMSRFRHSQAV